MRKVISVILAVLCLAGALCSCGRKAPEKIETRSRTAIRTIYGKPGLNHHFFWDVVREDGTIDGYEIWTTEKTFGGALEKMKVANFTVNEKGKLKGIKVVNYEIPKGTRWAFYINGVYSNENPKDLVTVNGNIYSLALVKK